MESQTGNYHLHINTNANNYFAANTVQPGREARMIYFGQSGVPDDTRVDEPIAIILMRWAASQNSTLE